VPELSERLRVVIVGDVDHGKSTLAGRLLKEAGAVTEGREAALAAASRKRGLELEWAFVTDSLSAERNLGGTIDTSEAVFRIGRRSFAIIDAPGQDIFLRNLVTGAAAADLAIITIDVAEGLLPQSRRHLYLLTLLGVRRIIVALNKMDRVDYSAERFAEAALQVGEYLRRIDIGAVAIIPISARHGEMIGSRSANLDWYHGPTLLEALDKLEPGEIAPSVLPLRFSVQDIYRFDERRILAGRVESGVLRVGDAVAIAPAGSVARVASIEDWNQPTRRLSASAGEAAGITLEPRVFAERGNIAALASEPMGLAGRLYVRLFWLSAERLSVGRSFGFRLLSGEYRVTVRSIDGIIDTETLERRPADIVLANEVAEVVLEAAAPIPVDRYAALPRTGRAVLTDGADALGGAIVLDFTETAARVSSNLTQGVSREEHERRHRHRGAVLWLTGMPGSGKSTLAAALERALFEGGMHAVMLDGDQIRQGLSRDLGFALDDRSENTRRIAETARLLADAGNIAIVALVCPLRADRARARAIVGDGFAEIHIHAELALCKTRDRKGLYARAQQGENNRCTDIESVYEVPEAPDLTIDTGKLDLAESVDRLVGFVDARFHDPRIDQSQVEPEWSV